MNSPVGSGIVLGGCRLSQTWNNEILDSLIDQLRSELEPTQRLVGWIGLGPKLWLKYHACPPRGPQIHGIGGIFQVVECLTPWLLLPVAALRLTVLEQCWEWPPAPAGSLYWAGSDGVHWGIVQCFSIYYNVVTTLSSGTIQCCTMDISSA